MGGYVLTRALPGGFLGDHGDVGNRCCPLGIAALSVETLIILLAVLAAWQARAVPRGPQPALGLRRGRVVKKRFVMGKRTWRTAPESVHRGVGGRAASVDRSGQRQVARGVTDQDLVGTGTRDPVVRRGVPG